MNNEKMGKFICDMRKSQKLTQKDLAEKLKITDKAVSKWERGISCPDISLLVPLAQALGVTTSELLNGEKGVQPEKTKDAIVEETLLYSSKSTTQKLERVKNIVFSLIILGNHTDCGDMHDLRFLHCRTPELVPYRISFAFVQLASAAAAVESPRQDYC